MIGLGFVEAKAGDTAASEAWFQKALIEDPDSGRVPLGFAKLYFEDGDNENAYTYYRKVFEANPNHYGAAVQSGVCQLRLRNFEPAIAHFEVAQEIRPEGWIPLYNIACAKALEGHVNEAFDFLGRVTAKVTEKGMSLLLTSLAQDTDLDSLRAYPRYVELVERAEIRAAELR